MTDDDEREADILTNGRVQRPGLLYASDLGFLAQRLVEARAEIAKLKSTLRAGMIVELIEEMGRLRAEIARLHPPVGADVTARAEIILARWLSYPQRTGLSDPTFAVLKEEIRLGLQQYGDERAREAIASCQRKPPAP